MTKKQKLKVEIELDLLDFWTKSGEGLHDLRDYDESVPDEAIEYVHDLLIQNGKQKCHLAKLQCMVDGDDNLSRAALIAYDQDLEVYNSAKIVSCSWEITKIGK